MAAKGSKNDDWFDNLDKELEKKTAQAQKSSGADTTLKGDLNRTLVSDFWKILLRFDKINIHFSIEPNHSQFAQFEKYPYEWTLKENYDFGGINQIQIVDRTRDQGRVGDSLRVRYYNEEETQHLRLTFEYCEGEHYYKYSGWKRIFGQYILFDAPVKKLDMDQFHTVLADVVRNWYDSHLKHSRESFLEYLEKTFEKGETYTQ
ncbi:MAG: hypothetical protein KAJ33_00290 [Thermoplasmata archaeon]|nr:hypothetical protein [Thermoplasmata archaeon]